MKLGANKKADPFGSMGGPSNSFGNAFGGSQPQMNNDPFSSLDQGNTSNSMFGGQGAPSTNPLGMQSQNNAFGATGNFGGGMSSNNDPFGGLGIGMSSA